MKETGSESGRIGVAREDGDSEDDAGSVAIEIFISPECPNCSQAVRAATQLAAANEHVRVTLIDVTEFPQRAADVGVRSVPLTIINGELTLVGAISADELAEAITTAAATGDASILRSLIEAGRFGAAGRMLIDGRGREAYLDQWRTSALESRIGLVLTAEVALGLDPRGLDPLVPHFVQILATDDAARRGDTADLLGMIGSPAARPALETLLDDPVADVAEIASEALESLLTDDDQG